MASITKYFLPIFFIISVTILSWAVVIMVDYYSGKGKSLSPHKLSDKPPFPGGKMKNIFWLLQVSDIHISKFRDPSRQIDLKSFCDENIDIIKPVAVLVTGDIVDAKDRFQIGSEQYVEEWQIYNKILQESGVTKKTEWLEVRGNHDNFNVPSLNSGQNMFRKFSISGSHPDRRDFMSYQFVYKTEFGKYSLNAVDASLDPGPKRPFNFFGHFNEHNLQELETVVDRSRNHNLSIWFGHYPLSTITGYYGRNLLKYGDVYLCGHLHTLGNLIPQMYAVHRNGHLELELGDWKDNRKYRVLVVDHDLVSFSDVTYGKWPVVVITNPKDAHYGIRAHEPLTRIRKSTHVRLLVFSPYAITYVGISIDDKPLTLNIQHVEGPLYVCPWDPEQYGHGLHHIAVTVKDAQGNSVKSTHVFSIDGSRPSLSLLPAVILLTDGQTLGQILYLLTFLFIICGPAIVRYNSLEKNTILRRFICHAATGVEDLSKTDSLFYPLFIYGIYTAIGPWFVAELTEGHTGLVFVHGLYVKGRWIPEATGYAYGVFQNLLFQLPLTVYMASLLGEKKASSTSYCKGATKPQYLVNDRRKWVLCRNFVMNSLLLLTFLLQVYVSLAFGRAYGIMAFVLSPVKTWSLILGVVLVRRTRKIVQKSG